MPRVGRRRTKNLKLLAGVRERCGAWYWQPTGGKERDARRERGEKVEVKLGPAGSLEARKKWIELTGLAAGATDGLVAELLELWERAGIKHQANGEPRADATVEQYESALPILKEKFGRCRYGKTAIEASRGEALGTAEIQRFIVEHQHKAMANRYFAVLDNAFSFGIRQGRTTYNPCEDVVKNPNGAREREPMPWEVECLRTLAKPRIGLQMDLEAIVGWRIGDVLTLLRAQFTADGLRVRYKKRGKRHLWEWSPELRRIWAEAEQLPFATKFPASPVFPSNRRKALSYAAFDDQWQKLKRATNAMLAAGISDPDTLAIAPALSIEDLHFHDLRSKAHDDAEDLGIEGSDFLGNTPAVAHRHYRRREQRRRPLK